MSSWKEKFSVVFWKMGVSWLKWQRVEDCSTCARLQLRMPGRQWCIVWFAVRWAFDWRQIAGVFPTHQSSANHCRDTEASVSFKINFPPLSRCVYWRAVVTYETDDRLFYTMGPNNVKLCSPFDCPIGTWIHAGCTLCSCVSADRCCWFIGCKDWAFDTRLESWQWHAVQYSSFWWQPPSLVSSVNILLTRFSTFCVMVKWVAAFRLSSTKSW